MAEPLGIHLIRTPHGLQPATAWDAERPASLSPIVIEQIIRQHIGFDGLLMRLANALFMRRRIERESQASMQTLHDVLART